MSGRNVPFQPTGSFRRRPESMQRPITTLDVRGRLSAWIPASAGMTPRLAWQIERALPLRPSLGPVAGLAANQLGDVGLAFGADGSREAALDALQQVKPTKHHG